MILPIRIDYGEMNRKLNAALSSYNNDVYGLYLMDLPYRAAELAFYLDGWLWGIRADDNGFFCYTKNRYNRLTSGGHVRFRQSEHSGVQRHLAFRSSESGHSS